MPHLDPRVRQISERVWIYLPSWHRLEPTLGLVLTAEGWVAIDGGNSPAQAQRAHQAMQRIRERPVHYVINTHRHFDHVFGNQVFEAPVVASRRCWERFRANLEGDWAPRRVDQWLREAMLPRVATLDSSDYEGLSLVPPAISFERRLHLDVGGAHLDLFPLDGAHSDDSIGVHLPDERVLFLGDALYLREGPESRFLRLLELVDTLAEFDVGTYVPGHEAPYRRMTFETVRSYCHELIRGVIAAIRSGASQEDVLRLPLAKRYENVSFLSPKMHRRLLRAAYSELIASQSHP